MLKASSCLALACAAVLCFCELALAHPMEIVLRLKEKVPMEQLAANVTNPESARYLKYYSPEEIRRLAGPTAAELEGLKNELKADGIQVTSTDKTGLFVTATAESQILEKVFSTRIVQDRTVGHGPLRTRITSPASIPSPLSMVASVSGLDTSRFYRPHLIINAHPRAGSAVEPETIKTVYGFDPLYKQGLTGKGQDIAIATYDGFHMTDIQQYYARINLPHTPKVDQVVFNGTPAVNDDSAVETEVDAEFSGMIAPEANIHIFASSHNDDPGETQIFTAILDDNRAKIVNYSWGMCETGVSPNHKTDMDKIYARAVAQGVNIMVASGDSGSDGCQDGNNVADYPASQPDVVAVGGTTLNVSDNQPGETAWNGSGGGVSSLYDLPSWQSALPAPYVKRSFPDVAFNADPNTGENAWVQYQTTTPDWVQIGGTSIAAPQWSGFMALVNEARAAKGPLGFLNPVIYALTSAQRTGLFHDVIQGSNGAYSAGPGWDAVTGWGSMQADQLLAFLSGK